MRNHRCDGNAITYSECVFAALVIQHAVRMSRIAVCGLSGHAIFFTSYLYKRHECYRNVIGQ